MEHRMDYDETTLLANLSKLPIPRILIGTYSPVETEHLIFHDFVRTGSEAVSLLANRGHKRLAIFHSGKDKLRMTGIMFDGFRVGLKRYGIKYEPVMEVTDYNSDGRVCMDELVSRDYMPTGLIMTESFMGGAVEWLGNHKQQGWSPECVGIVSRPEACSSLPPGFVASVLIPVKQIGYEAGLRAKELVDNPDMPASKWSISPLVLSSCD